MAGKHAIQYKLIGTYHMPIISHNMYVIMYYWNVDRYHILRTWRLSQMVELLWHCYGLWPGRNRIPNKRPRALFRAPRCWWQFSGKRPAQVRPRRPTSIWNFPFFYGVGRGRRHYSCFVRCRQHTDLSTYTAIRNEKVAS